MENGNDPRSTQKYKFWKSGGKNIKKYIVVAVCIFVIGCTFVVGAIFSQKTEKDPIAAEQSVNETLTSDVVHLPEVKTLKTTGDLGPASPLAAGDPALFSWKNINSIVKGSNFVAGLKSNGTVVVEVSDDTDYDEDYDVSSWQNIKKITAAGHTLVGLKSDGTVVVAGNDFEENSEIPSWRNIVDVSTCGYYTVGVRSDGRLEYSGLSRTEFEEEGFYPMIGVKTAKAFSCDGGINTLALTEDGILVSNGQRYKDVASSGWLSTGIREDGSVYFWGIDAGLLQREMLLWKDIKQVCPTDSGAIGLQNDGTLVFAGYTHWLDEAKAWTDIDRIILIDDAFDYFLVGIKTNRTVVATGGYEVDTSSWSDIVDVTMFDDMLVGLKRNGTIVTANCGDEKEIESYDYDQILESLPMFDNGWLTFAHGGSMFVPENFRSRETENQNESSKRQYDFFDIKNNMSLQVYERFILDEENYISSKYAELCDTYKDATYKNQGDSFCVVSGYMGSHIYYIRCEMRDGYEYSFSCRYPSSKASVCDPIVEKIENSFLKDLPANRYSIYVCPSKEVCDEDHSYSFGFSDGRKPKSVSRYALCCTNEATGSSMAIATIDLPAYNSSWKASNDDCLVVGHKDNIWLFYIWHDTGMWSTFLFDALTEEITYLEEGPIVYNGDFNDEIILGQWQTFGTGITSPMFLYDWEGNLLLKKDAVYGATLYNETVYYVILNDDAYEVHSIDIDSLQNQKLCEIVLPENETVYIDGNKVVWEYADTNHNWQSGSMNLGELHDVKIEGTADTEKPATTKEPTTTEGSTTTKEPENKMDLYQRLARQVEQHYTDLFKPAGSYVCFENDYDETDEEFVFVLRYQMSEEEIAQREAKGAVVEPNVYTATVWINKTTGAARDEWNYDNWYADLA